MKMLLILGLMIGVGSVTARAQALSEGTIEADIPYAFTVMGTTLPAGKYVVSRVVASEPLVLEMRSADGHTAVLFGAEIAQVNQIPRNAELVFDQIGDRYFLSQIWASDSDIGYQLIKTKAERTLESAGPQAEHHSIVAKLFKRTKKEK
jgi:hypothetical protein